MGGGVGLSIYGSHRVITDSTLMAMPEVMIGIVPDVGAGYFFSKCKAEGVGLFLGLTGKSIHCEDIMKFGFGTHYSRDLKIVEQAFLSDQVSWSEYPHEVHQQVDLILKKVTSEVPRHPKSMKDDELELIASLFGFSAVKKCENLHQLIDHMKSFSSENPFLKELLSYLDESGQCCPLACHVWYQHYRNTILAPHSDLATVFKNEFILNSQLLLGINFQIGVNNKLLAKGDLLKTRKFEPCKLEDVKQEDVDKFFEKCEF